MPPESLTLGLTHLQFEAMLTAARLWQRDQHHEAQDRSSSVATGLMLRTVPSAKTARTRLLGLVALWGFYRGLLLYMSMSSALIRPRSLTW